METIQFIRSPVGEKVDSKGIRQFSLIVTLVVLGDLVYVSFEDCKAPLVFLFVIITSVCDLLKVLKQSSFYAVKIKFIYLVFGPLFLCGFSVNARYRGSNQQQ